MYRRTWMLWGPLGTPVVVIYVFVAAADSRNPLGHYGECGVRNVTRIAAVYEAFAESSYDSEAVFHFPQQGQPTVGGYFVGTLFKLRSARMM